MARLDEFHERFIPIVESFIRQTGNRTDKGIGQFLGVCRQTIASWRKKYPEFQQAIANPNLRIAQKVEAGLEKLVTDGRIEVIKNAKGDVKETRILPPTAQDFSVALKAGFGGAVKFNEREETREQAQSLKVIAKRLQSGAIDYLDALTECELENLPVPSTWGTREIQRILSLPRTEQFTALNAVQMLEAAGLVVPRSLMLEVEKLLGSGEQDDIRIYHAMDPPGAEDD